MQRKKTFKIFVIALLIVSGTALSASEVLAKPHSRSKSKRGHHSSYRRHHHPYYGRKVSFPEMLAKAIFVSGLKYFYSEGVFYKKTHGGYIIVDAPVGARVRTLPLGAKRVLINGRRYYYYNDVYFARKPLGYYVVEDPIYEIVDLPKQVVFVDNTVLSTGSQINNFSINKNEEFVVNILNANGSYTPVKIVRSVEGYVGPQGEYYTEFPKVEQLRIMYGR